MNRLKNITGSVLGRSVRIRITRPVFNLLAEHLSQDHQEQFAYGLYSQARTPDGTILIVQDLMIPDKEDLSQQGAAGVIPHKNFQSLVYFLAQQRNCGVLDIHTHPFQPVPHFSGIDEVESLANAKDLCRLLDSAAPHLMLVFGKGINYHDAVVYDRSLNGYRSVDSIDILGRGTDIRLIGSDKPGLVPENSPYSRQNLIPGWNQIAIARQRIAIIGAGGNGAQILQTLVSIGTGVEGWVTVIDPDTIETSNLPRIPYAGIHDVGQPKVTVAAQYAHLKNPQVKFFPYPCSVTEKAAQDRIKGATLIIGAGDRDSARKVCNELAVQYCIPYIDLGCDIHTEEDTFEAAGQIRIILPGQNACMVCQGGFDASVAALELMDDVSALQHAAAGYGQGQQAAPSIANLNASTAQMGVTAFLSLVLGSAFGTWDYLHYAMTTGQTMTASTQQHEKCPLCCREGLLAKGDTQLPEVPKETVWINPNPKSDHE